MSGRRQSRRDPVLDISENQLLWGTCIALLCLSVLALIGVFTLTVVAPEAFGDTTTTTTVFVTPAPTPPPPLNTCSAFTSAVESLQPETRVCANSLPGRCSRTVQQRCEVIQAVRGDVPLDNSFESTFSVCEASVCTGDSETRCDCPITSSDRFCQRTISIEFPVPIAFPCRAPRTCTSFSDVDLQQQAPCTLGFQVEEGFCANDGETCNYRLIVGGTTDNAEFESRSCRLIDCTPLNPCSCPDLACTRAADTGFVFTMACV